MTCACAHVWPACSALCFLQVAEEIKFEPKVSCKVMDESVTFKEADLLHGDILLVQKVLTQVHSDMLCLDVAHDAVTTFVL